MFKAITTLNTQITLTLAVLLSPVTQDTLSLALNSDPPTLCLTAHHAVARKRLIRQISKDGSLLVIAHDNP